MYCTTVVASFTCIKLPHMLNKQGDLYSVYHVRYICMIKVTVAIPNVQFMFQTYCKHFTFIVSLETTYTAIYQ